MSLNLLVRSTGKKYSLEKGGKYKFNAVSKETYELIATDGKVLLNETSAQRKGNDLVLASKDEDIEVTIEGFWKECKAPEDNADADNSDDRCFAVLNTLDANAQPGVVTITQNGPILSDLTAGQVGTLEDCNNGLGAIFWLGAAGLLAGAVALGAGGSGGGGGRGDTDDDGSVHIDSNDDGDIDNSSPSSVADKPSITPNETDGSVTVTPGANNVKVNVTFKDEDGNDKIVVAEKGEDGKWKLTDPSNTGATIDPDTGVITIPQDSVKDGEPINATGTDDKGATAPADPVNAGTDGKDAAVDANGGVVTSQSSVDEGGQLVTTVKLTNNNGVDNLTIATAGTATAEDFGTPTYSNGVTANDDGTLNVPAGVTEFTITVPVKADETTEGNETVQYTVGGVAGNEVTINDTSLTNATDKPSITPNEADGSVTVTPGANNVKVDVTFKDEDGNDKTVVAEKGEDGKWKLTDPDNTGATIDPDTGVITIPQDSVKDGEPVNATGTDDKGATAPADPVNAGTDGKDAAVDANGGVVTSQSSVDEGGQLVTTVKLTNNNGVDNLTITTAGSATPEDFGAPTYSNGVTANEDGTLNVPAGVTEFTITVPVKADETTEGNETVQYTVGGVAGNEVTINDTSLTNATDKPSITPNETDGSVTVTPGANNVKVEVNFPGEDDEPNKVTGTKGEDGKWTLDDPNNTGATIDPDTGVITIPQDSVKDGEPVNATGTDDKGATVPADPVNAGIDGKDAAVDANGGVVTSPSSVDEGAELVTTVKLTNNNGADNLTITTAGSASAEDFGTPVYSNGVTANDDGTLNVPAGVTEFTITVPVIADESTEGAETVQYTVGGVAGNEVTINDTSLTNATDKPSITPNETDGSVTVTPGANNVKVDVTFKDEDGNDKTVVAEKGEDGKWTLDDPNNTGATIDPETGVITIPQDSVKDGEPVNATGTDDKGATAPADPVNAGTDGKDAAVDANGGVVTGPSSVDEGGQLVTTVKLTNNNGADNLTIATAGTATAEDFGTPTYSNGVTANDDGTLNVPAGVTEFTITVPVKADETTEGNETVQYTVGGVAGNEVTINDTSLTNATDKPSITPNETDGSVTVTPGANNVKVDVTFKDEDGNDKTVVAEKGEDGKWKLTDPNNTGATIDPETGVITIPQDSVKDGEPVNATGTDGKGATAPADPVNAGSDSKDAAVDANGGVVTSPETVDEGAELVTTVKLTNNNGVDNLTITTAGSATPEDFGTPTYSNGVIANEDGTLNVPAGVTEFTITVPVKADESTEGAETVQYTVGGVAGNEVTINDTSLTNATDKPSITPNEADGSVTVTPGADNVKVEITFKDEDGNDKTVVAEKGENGWTITDDGTGATVDPSTGVINIPQDSVKDGEPVNATGTDDKGVTAPADPVNAGSDSKDAAVDANGGVVTSPSSVDEGAELVTTVKLTNNNGADNLTIATAGSASAEDFGTPVYSNGVTVNDDGTLNVPAGVTEFTITTPVKEDESTEGNETVKYTVGGVNGNEVTINDTSVTSSAAKVDNSNNNGVVTSPTPVNEGANLVTTVKLTNGNGVEGLVVNRQGTGAKPTSDADFDDTTTIYKAYDANGNEVANGVTVVGGKLNVAAGVREFEIVTKVKEDDTTEGDETVKYTVGGVDGNEVIINDTSMTPTVVPTPVLGWLPLILQNHGDNVISGLGKPNSTFTLGGHVINVGANGHWQTDQSFTEISQLDNRGGAGVIDQSLLIEAENGKEALLYVFDKVDNGPSGLNGHFDFRDRPDYGSVNTNDPIWGTSTSFQHLDKGVTLLVDGNLSGSGGGIVRNGFAVYLTDKDDIVNIHQVSNNTGIGMQDSNTGVYMGDGNDIYITDNITFSSGAIMGRVPSVIDMGAGDDFYAVREKMDNSLHAHVSGGEGFDTFVLGYEKSDRNYSYEVFNLNKDRISGFEHIIISKDMRNLGDINGKITLNIKTDDILENNTRYIDGGQNVKVNLEDQGFQIVQSGVKFKHNDFYGNEHTVVYNKYVSGDNILYIEQSITNVIV